MPTRTNERSLYGDIYSLLFMQQVSVNMLPQVVSSRETMANCSPRLLLAKLHDEFAMGRVRFVTARSIGRLRQALHGLYSAIGGSSSARHAARFNLLGKSHRLGCDIDFAEKVITTFDRKKTRARKRAVLAGERMAIRIHIGDVRGSSRRNAGSWAAQSNMSAALGSSECKTFCNNIIKRNRKRSKSFRLSTPVILFLEQCIATIQSNKWGSTYIGKKALKSSFKLLFSKYRRSRIGSMHIGPRQKIGIVKRFGHT